MWTVFYFLKRFVYDLYRAIVFSALEYDVQLKMTKTPGQRTTIWIIIAIVSLIVSYGLLHAIWYFIDTLDTSRIEI